MKKEKRGEQKKRFGLKKAEATEGKKGRRSSIIKESG